MSERFISVRGAAVHNLKDIDLDIPHRRLVVLCGLSGSGKTSLALDTMYAEGQRRYIDSFSAYTRQFLERLEKPEADRIDGIPPAIAVTHKNTSRSNRATVGTATETSDYLRLLFAKFGRVFCLKCGREVRRDTPQTAAEQLAALPAGTRFQVTFAVAEDPAATGDPNGDGEKQPVTSRDHAAEWLAASTELQEDGFLRVIADGRTIQLAEATAAGASGPVPAKPWHVVVDRLTAGSVSEQRLRDSLESAFVHGHERCAVFVEHEQAPDEAREHGTEVPAPQVAGQVTGGPLIPPDGGTVRRIGFSNQLTCETCQIEYPAPEPRLYSFNSPLGACPECEGFGNVIDVDLDLVVPDPGKIDRRMGRSRRGIRPPMPMNCRSCWPWRAIMACRSMCRFANSPPSSGN